MYRFHSSQPTQKELNPHPLHGANACSIVNPNVPRFGLESSELRADRSESGKNTHASIDAVHRSLTFACQCIIRLLKVPTPLPPPPRPRPQIVIDIFSSLASSQCFRFSLSISPFLSLLFPHPTQAEVEISISPPSRSFAGRTAYKARQHGCFPEALHWALVSLVPALPCSPPPDLTCLSQFLSVFAPHSQYLCSASLPANQTFGKAISRFPGRDRDFANP